ncbi:MAG: DUF6114 domain-containing protein [Actinoplanes sp.]
MTTAEPEHDRPKGSREKLGGFRRWRRTRPFWGGLLTVLAGLEIFGTTQMALAGLSFQLGPTGFLSWLVPTVLVTCGLLMWFSPQHRVLYSVVAAVTALFSLIGVNLGGFFLGLLLGLVGSALGFGWVPGAHSAARSGIEPADDQDDETVRGEPKLEAGRDLPTADTEPATPSAINRPSSTS